MKKNLKLYFAFVFGMMLLSCGGSDGGGDPPPPTNPTPPPIAAPSAASLIFPDNNEECTEGVVLNDNQSRVTFEWNAAQNTDSYELTVINLNSSNEITTTVTTEEASLTLSRGVPYEWFVISRASGTNETATSPTWRFYNAGAGVLNYAPFPAEALFPSRGSQVADTGTLNLQWSGSDVDDDIADFDVLFDTVSPPVNQAGTTTDPQLEVNISSGTVYYWQVISRDAQGNTSNSEIFQFQVN